MNEIPLKRTIFKYPLSTNSTGFTELKVNMSMDSQCYDLPKVLSVGLDPQGEPCIWIEQDIVKGSLLNYDIHAVATGGVLPTYFEINNFHFVGTFIHNGEVWHAYYEYRG